MKKIFNFSAGPSMLPKQVLNQIQQELYDWNNLGISIMEISHRSLEFMELVHDTKRNLRNLLNIPNSYEILFCHGGARAQFSAIPMNFLRGSADNIDYINTGYWGYLAAIESKKYCHPNIINISSSKNELRYIKPMSEWNISKNSTYIHYCPNETVEGISIDDIPDCFEKKIVIADFSSTLLSRPVNVNNFGMIYAAAQKNMGISGLTVLIIRRSLINNISTVQKIPAILNYRILADSNSMFNTPVTVSWYIANLVFKWLQDQGGLDKIAEYNKKKSNLLYHAIDSNDFYYNNIHSLNRSRMNIPFFLKKEKLNSLFLSESTSFGLHGLKGHKVIGGMRASLYNAMTLEGVQKLVNFMNFFSKKYG
ncbi:phosphoserine aminotransferase [Candidatus Blochmanniella floridana]|uniref:Phosphoserine aminotransferase n=1 Tax=Blochmanniella floridana TaxID=203907 RepID=SERC_BLOFL|nr:RecName: Full=Phosphoserine aminotransferase; AltName: Full=Phosphohydroxythreonine aminotransferase; Short=PSAT [Candidatus Blochmannia floridanus]CAD83449.1 phosphoserine aminotransferase [Candidatus Blochmannia floridanus]